MGLKGFSMGLEEVGIVFRNDFCVLFFIRMVDFLVMSFVGCYDIILSF